ncbi:MAG TPA: hypothetical protein VHU84_14835, partial [Lacipirellulaceae bacterium]|nr:hypothetical protein [Lacipirellulaceae bacterium]
MLGRKNHNGANWRYSLTYVSAILLASIAYRADAVGLNYVDGNANPFAGTVNLSGDTFTLSPANGMGVGDGHWDLRAFGAAGGIYESGGLASETTCAGCTAEGAPEITQTVTGLTPGASYDMYAAFWSADGQNWMQRAGLASGNLTLYDRNGPVPAAPTAIAATNAASAVWDSPPPANIAGTTLYHEGDRSMLLGFAGTATADINGQVIVYLNDLPATGAQRSFFDGVAYTAANAQIALTATINRTTGALTVANPTSGNFQIVSYTINST